MATRPPISKTDRSRREGLPLCLIAIEDQRVVGALALADRAINTHPDLTPCVIGFWVEPTRRNRGICALLLKAACDHARSAGFPCLYTCTNTASRLFIREAWLKIDVGRTNGGEIVDVFEKKLA